MFLRRKRGDENSEGSARDLFVSAIEWEIACPPSAFGQATHFYAFLLLSSSLQTFRRFWSTFAFDTIHNCCVQGGITMQHWDAYWHDMTHSSGFPPFPVCPGHTTHFYAFVLPSSSLRTFRRFWSSFAFDTFHKLAMAFYGARKVALQSDTVMLIDMRWHIPLHFLPSLFVWATLLTFMLLSFLPLPYKRSEGFGAVLHLTKFISRLWPFLVLRRWHYKARLWCFLKPFSAVLTLPVYAYSTHFYAFVPPSSSLQTFRRFWSSFSFDTFHKSAMAFYGTW